MIKSFLDQIFSFRILENRIINPFIGLEIASLGNYQGVNKEISREVPIIVSLSSNRENFRELSLTLYSLLNQTLKPDKIVLWLDEECEDFASLPYEITQFIKNGLEIKFVKDIGSYTKTIYALENYPNAILATADDKVYYPTNWLYRLYMSYIAHPDDIQVHNAMLVDIDSSFSQWKKSKSKTADYRNFMLSKNGILYPPNCFSREVLRKDIYLKQAANADNVWLWFLALINNRKIRIVNNNIKTVLYTNPLKQIKISKEKKKNKVNTYDNAIQSLLKLYGRNIYNRLNK